MLKIIVSIEREQVQRKISDTEKGPGSAMGLMVISVGFMVIAVATYQARCE
jgi:hypothetical protein